MTGSFQRKVLKPFTLSNGQYIPAGAFIELPGILTVQDEQYYPSPEKFDALRFYDNDVNPSASANAQQFVSVSNSSLTWGYGRHACPGRFLANNELKMILAHALMNYDWKLPDGVTERYPDRIYSSAVSLSSFLSVCESGCIAHDFADKRSWGRWFRNQTASS